MDIKWFPLIATGATTVYVLFVFGQIFYDEHLRNLKHKRKTEDFLKGRSQDNEK